MRTFGFRQAAEFWEVAGDCELAFRLHALVGGAPEYKDLCDGAGPRSLADFDQWVQLRLLNPASVMFRSGGLALGEAAPAADLAACVSVLGAIAAGAARPSEIAAALGRTEGAVDDPLAALTAMGVIERLQDPLDGARSGLVIVRPIARLYQLVVAPYEAELAAGQADRVWGLSRAAVEGGIYRPHFASVARQWCLRHAAEETVGGVARAARPTAIACREHQREHELEAIFVEEPVATGRVLAIGETNAVSGPMDAGQLRRLDHLRALLPDERVGQPPRLLLFSRSGFAAGLAAEAAARPDVELVDLERLYRGG
jgi:DNA-binding MarR family transcriptional regulator